MSQKVYQETNNLPLTVDTAAALTVCFCVEVVAVVGAVLLAVCCCADVVIGDSTTVLAIK